MQFKNFGPALLPLWVWFQTLNISEWHYFRDKATFKSMSIGPSPAPPAPGETWSWESSTTGLRPKPRPYLPFVNSAGEPQHQTLGILLVNTAVMSCIFKSFIFFSRFYAWVYESYEPHEYTFLVILVWFLTSVQRRSARRCTHTCVILPRGKTNLGLQSSPRSSPTSSKETDLLARWYALLISTLPMEHLPTANQAEWTWWQQMLVSSTPLVKAPLRRGDLGKLAPRTLLTPPQHDHSTASRKHTSHHITSPPG